MQAENNESKDETGTTADAKKINAPEIKTVKKVVRKNKQRVSSNILLTYNHRRTISGNNTSDEEPETAISNMETPKRDNSKPELIRASNHKRKSAGNGQMPILGVVEFESGVSPSELKRARLFKYIEGKNLKGDTKTTRSRQASNNKDLAVTFNNSPNKVHEWIWAVTYLGDDICIEATSQIETYQREKAKNENYNPGFTDISMIEDIGKIQKFGKIMSDHCFIREIQSINGVAGCIVPTVKNSILLDWIKILLADPNWKSKNKELTNSKIGKLTVTDFHQFLVIYAHENNALHFGDKGAFLDEESSMEPVTEEVLKIKTFCYKMSKNIVFMILKH